MRDSFVLYVKYLENIELLNMEQRGILLTALMKYALKDEIPEMDGMTKMAFSFIKSQLDRDFKKYDETCKKRAESGKLGGRPKNKADDFKENHDKAKKANGFSEKQNNPDNDNEYDNDNENDIKNKYTCAFEQLWTAYPRKKEKARAYKCYKARLNDGFSEDELLSAVKRYAEECKESRTEDKYIKLASTFLSSNTPFVDYLGDYTPPKKKANISGFNNAPERIYSNMDELTRGLIE